MIKISHLISKYVMACVQGKMYTSFFFFCQYKNTFFFLKSKKYVCFIQSKVHMFLTQNMHKFSILSCVFLTFNLHKSVCICTYLVTKEMY